MSEPTEVKKKPEPRITIQTPAGEREVFMSFGLLNELTALIGTPEQVPALSFNPGISSAAIELLLSTRNKRGKIDDEQEVAAFELEIDEAERLLDWAGEHVLDFFVRRFAMHAKQLAAKAGPLAEVGSSLTSSVNSAGKTV